MQVEQLEILRFISKYPPFNALPEDAQRELARNIEIAYFREDSAILNYGDPLHDLYVLRSGAVETFRRTGQLYSRLSAGGIFGQAGLMMNQTVRFPVRAIEDSLIYCIPIDLFKRFCSDFEEFADYFETDEHTQLRKAIDRSQDDNDLTSVRVKSLLTGSPAKVTADTSIQEAARLMAEENTSALLVIENNHQATDTLAGIVTDRDFCTRVLATGKSAADPVANIMSTNLATLDENDYLFEAMMLMLRHNVHHLPIMARESPVGLLQLADVVRHESKSSILLVRSIFDQTSIEDLQAVAAQLPEVFVRMVRESADPHMIGSALSVIGRSIKQRLLELAEEQLGPPPIPYCFVALGSMARDEQLIYTDQDNALILDDHYIEAEHGVYFAELAQFVCDGLEACGYRNCDGQVMASNPQWRMPLAQWKQHFADWIDNATPQNLLSSNIFFDLQAVWGQRQWVSQLRQFLTLRARNTPRFLAAMASNALRRTAPLGFFKNFVVEKDGQHKNSINLKRRGTAPLSDLVRIHALAVGSTAVNSFERLDDINEAGLLPEHKGRDLYDALEYIYLVRIEHQARQIEQGEEPNNNVLPSELSSFERRNLKEAFQVLSHAQNFIKFRYNPTTR